MIQDPIERMVLAQEMCTMQDIIEEARLDQDDLQILWYLYANGPASSEKLKDEVGAKNLSKRLAHLRRAGLVSVMTLGPTYMLRDQAKERLGVLRGIWSPTESLLWEVLQEIPIGRENAIPKHEIQSRMGWAEGRSVLLVTLLKTMHKRGLIQRGNVSKNKYCRYVYWRETR